MSKVNFVSEFNSIMRYARDYSLSLRERMLWIALFYIANDRAVYNEQTSEYEWPDGFIQVSNGELNLYCCLDKRAIETLRNTLKQRGVLDFQPGVKNKRNPAYKLNYLTVGYKNVPNNVPSGTSNTVPNHVPNHVPNPASNAVPVYTEQGAMLGTKMHPTMSPYPKDNNTNHTRMQAGTGVSQGEGFVNLNVVPVCSGFVPLPWEEGNA